MTNEYKPTSTLLRSTFLAAALLITVAIGALIDVLAAQTGDGAMHAAASEPPEAVLRV